MSPHGDISEQEPQNIPPHLRQWCRRLASQKEFRQCWQRGAAASGNQRTRASSHTSNSEALELPELDPPGAPGPTHVTHEDDTPVGL